MVSVGYCITVAARSACSCLRARHAEAAPAGSGGAGECHLTAPQPHCVCALQGKRHRTQWGLWGVAGSACKVSPLPHPTPSDPCVQLPADVRDGRDALATGQVCMPRPTAAPAPMLSPLLTCGCRVRTFCHLCPLQPGAVEGGVRCRYERATQRSRRRQTRAGPCEVHAASMQRACALTALPPLPPQCSRAAATWRTATAAERRQR